MAKKIIRVYSGKSRPAKNRTVRIAKRAASRLSALYSVLESSREKPVNLSSPSDTSVIARSGSGN